MGYRCYKACSLSSDCLLVQCKDLYMCLFSPFQKLIYFCWWSNTSESLNLLPEALLHFCSVSSLFLHLRFSCSCIKIHLPSKIVFWFSLLFPYCVIIPVDFFYYAVQEFQLQRCAQKPKHRFPQPGYVKLLQIHPMFKVNTVHLYYRKWLKFPSNMRKWNVGYQKVIYEKKCS